METMSYVEASKVLNRSYETIKQAVANKVLTKYVTLDKRTCLIKAQVLLFEGKPRISKRCLDAQEAKEWEKYENIAMGGVRAENVGAQEDIKEAMQQFEESVNEKIAALGEMITNMFRPQKKTNILNNTKNKVLTN